MSSSSSKPGVLAGLPEAVLSLTGRCEAHVYKRFGLNLDYTSDTLSLLDHFVTCILTEENQGTLPAIGAPIRMSVMSLFAPTLASYFGTMLANTFGATWRFTNQSPNLWRLDFSNVFLRINPMAVASNAMAGVNIFDDGPFWKPRPHLLPLLNERIKAMPKVPEDELFSFETAFEVVQVASDFLLACAQKAGRPDDCSESAYQNGFIPAKIIDER